MTKRKRQPVDVEKLREKAAQGLTLIETTKVLKSNNPFVDGPCQLTVQRKAKELGIVYKRGKVGRPKLIK